MSPAILCKRGAVCTPPPLYARRIAGAHRAAARLPLAGRLSGLLSLASDRTGGTPVKGYAGSLPHPLQPARSAWRSGSAGLGLGLRQRPVPRLGPAGPRRP